MNPLLRTLFRLVFLGWLAAVLICGAVVANKTDSPMYGASLLTFLFTRKLPFAFETPPPPPELPLEEAAEEPAPPPVPAPASKPVRPLVPSGPKQGRGTLSKPDFTLITDSAGASTPATAAARSAVPVTAIEVRIAYQGTVGEKRSHQAANVASVSLDLLGAWNGLSGEFVPPDNPLIKKLQVGRHEDRVRFSALAQDPAKPTRLRGEMYQEEGAIILVFSNTAPSAETTAAPVTSQAASQATSQARPVQTLAPAPVQTLAPAPVQTSAPVQVETPSKTPVETPSKAQTPVKAPAQTPSHAPAQAPLNLGTKGAATP